MAVLAVCLTIAGSWKLLVADYNSTFAGAEDFVGARRVESPAGFDNYPAVDRSSEDARDLLTSSPITNSGAYDAKRPLPSPELSPEQFNAALAAGLIDPSRFRLIQPSVPSPSSAGERATSLSGLTMRSQNAAHDSEPESALVSAATPTSTHPAATGPSGRPNAVSSLAQAMDKPVFAPAGESAEATSTGGLLAPIHGEALRKGSIPKKKTLSVGFIEKEKTKATENSSTQRLSRNDPPPQGAKGDKSTDPKADNRESQSRDLSQNLQRFASDFVRADQSENISEQQRFFAESVHFYHEGDLSLAGVEAATRRYHREQQTKRSEAAGPAVAIGPVNGGFFVIEQPVRWTRSQGSKVTQGRSVLRLRVVPISPGDWRITSIDEANK